MKVFILNLYLSRKGGGIFTVIKELYNSTISKAFFNSNLFFLGYDDEFFSQDSTILNGKVICLKKENSFFYSSDLKEKLQNLNSPDNIVHLHSLWMYPSFILKKLSAKSNFKKIISPHGMLDSWALSNGKLKKRLILNFFEKRNLKTADCIHALCFQEYQDIRKITKTTPVAIIPNGINLPKFDKELEKEKNILFLARLHPKKGIDNLIEAWKLIETKDWNLTIVGPDEGNYEEKIGKVNENLPPDKRKIKFIGGAFGKDKAQLYQKASIFILPSFSEGLPMTILEAWSYKLPVLMTKECNLEIGFNENAASKIEASVNGIRKGIEKFINLPENELNQIGLNGYNLVQKEFTWEEVSKKMIHTYKWIIEETEKPNFIYLD